MSDGTRRPDAALGRQALDHATAPWRAEVVVTSTPYECMVSGRTDSHVALRLTHRWDTSIAPVLVAPAVITGLVHAGLGGLGPAIDQVA